MNNNPLLGKLVSEHSRGDYRRRGLLGCGLILVLPLGFGVWGIIAYLTSDKTGDALAGLAVSLTVVAISLGLFGLFVLLYFLSPRWLKKYKVEIYENGFMLRTPFKNQTCLWSEIEEVNPVLLTTPANRSKTRPGEFEDFANTEYGGVYEVHKKDGTKILVSRQYNEIQRIDSELIRFCKEVPSWSKEK